MEKYVNIFFFEIFFYENLSYLFPFIQIIYLVLLKNPEIETANK